MQQKTAAKLAILIYGALPRELAIANHDRVRRCVKAWLRVQSILDHCPIEQSEIIE
jgi:hypothetical protein